MLESYLTLGIIISLVYDEWIGVSPSGLITPGYLALFMDQPMRLVYTVGIAIATVGVLKFLEVRMPIYGKRQFAVAVTVALILRSFISGAIENLMDGAVIVTAVGNIIPGLMANEMHKQGITRTLIHTAIVTITIYLILLVAQGRVI